MKDLHQQPKKTFIHNHKHLDKNTSGRLMQMSRQRLSTFLVQNAKCKACLRRTNPHRRGCRSFPGVGHVTHSRPSPTLAVGAAKTRRRVVAECQWPRGHPRTLNKMHLHIYYLCLAANNVRLVAHAKKVSRVFLPVGFRLARSSRSERAVLQAIKMYNGLFRRFLNLSFWELEWWVFFTLKYFLLYEKIVIEMIFYIKCASGLEIRVC